MDSNQYINTDGGSHVSGDVNTNGGNFTGRDLYQLVYRPTIFILENQSPQALSQDEIANLFYPPSIPLSYKFKLVGREKLLSSLKAKLLANNHIALKGLPGVGKTALAMELAHDPDIKRHFTGGILWIKAGRNADLITILLELGVFFGILSSTNNKVLADSEQKDRTIEILRQNIQSKISSDNKQFLVILDDVWTIETALNLHFDTSNCVYLVTTRFVPITIDFTVTDSIQTVEELTENSSLELLEQVSGDIVRIHRGKTKELLKKVGYLPLALILIGRYLKNEGNSNSPGRINEALKKLEYAKFRLELEQSQLSLGSNPSLPSSTPLSLLSVIMVSEEALNDEERLTLYALSVFPPKPNTFSEEAALAISSTSNTALYKLYDVGLLESDKSGRYMLHQTIADYARERLNSASVYTRMATFFVTYTEKNIQNYQLIDQEYINIVAALEVAIKTRMDHIAKRGIDTFYFYLQDRGFYEKAKEILVEVQRLLEDTREPCMLGSVFLNLGRLTQRLGQYTQSKDYLNRALTLGKECNDWDLIIYSKLNLGVLEEIQGSDEYAKNLYYEALNLAKTINNEKAVCLLSQIIGVLLLKIGDYSQARNLLFDGLAKADIIGDEEIGCRLLITIGSTLVALGEFESAQVYYRKSIQIARKLHHYQYEVHIQLGLAEIARKKGDYPLAKRYYNRGIKLATQSGYHELKIVLLQNLHVLFSETKKYQQASDSLQEALLLAFNIGHLELIDHILKDLEKLANIQEDL